MWDYLQEFKHTLQQEGYLQTSFDTLWSATHQLQILAKVGPRFHWVTLDAGNIDPLLLSKVSFRERFFRSKPFHYREVAHLMQKLLKEAGTSGYPFAEAGLDSVSLNGSEVTAKLYLNPGPSIAFGDLQLTGQVKSNERFLQNYLKLWPGEPFSEETVGKIPARLSRLPYLTLNSAPELSFQNNQATVYLEVAKRPANQIDGVIGFLPNSVNKEGKLLLTGQFNLALYNMFGNGRQLKINWESFKPRSQSMKLEFYQPLILGSPLNTGFRFGLLKEDSTFVNTHFQVDLSYPLSTNSTFNVFGKLRSTSLSANHELRSSNRLPDFADTDLSLYGVGYEWARLDHYLHPTSGTSFGFNLSAGNRKLRRNSALQDSLYRNVDRTTTQAGWEAVVKHFIKLNQHWVLAVRGHGGGIYNKRLFLNDLFRLGGLKSIRGFPENGFFASEYIYTVLEPRFYFDTDSYLFAFFDKAWLMSYTLETSEFNDRPSGLGAGISFVVKGGKFNLAWAVGRSDSQELDVRQSKIHFGYVTEF